MGSLKLTRVHCNYPPPPPHPTPCPGGGQYLSPKIDLLSLYTVFFSLLPGYHREFIKNGFNNSPVSDNVPSGYSISN